MAIAPAVEAPSRVVLHVDYSILPSIVPVVERGGQASLMRFGIVNYPDRAAMDVIDTARIARICPLMPGERTIPLSEAVQRVIGFHLLDVWGMESLLKNPRYIPGELKDGLTLFPGKILEDRFGEEGRLIPGFAWNGKWWIWRGRYLKLAFTKRNFFAYQSA